MKEQLASLLRHAFTALAGLGGFLFSKGLIDQGDVTAVDGAGVSLGNALVVILVAVIGRLLITLTAKFFRLGAGELENDKSKPSGGTLLLIIGTTAALGGLLPSCSPAQLDAARAFPIRIGITTDQGTASYSSKSGLSAVIDARSGK